MNLSAGPGALDRRIWAGCRSREIAQIFQGFRLLADELGESFLMANFIPMIGLDPAELVSVRTLVYLLRHPDPVVPELTLQALSYLEARASGTGVDSSEAGPAPPIQDSA